MSASSHKDLFADDQYFLERSSLYLYITCGTLLVGSIGYLIAVYLTASGQVFTIRGGGAAIAAAIALAGLVLVWSKREKSAIATILIGMWMYTTWIAAYEGALHTADLLVYPLIVILMGWRLGVRYAFAIAGISILACIAFYLMEVWRLLPVQLPQKPPEAALLVDVLVVGFAAATANFLVRSYRDRLLEIAALTQDLAAQRDTLEEKVAARTLELARAKEVAEAANIAKSAFLSNMSHEMRTPLHQVIGLAHLVEREPLSATQSDRMDKIDVAVKHLDGMIERILELTAIEANRVSFLQAPVDVDRLVRNAAEQISQKAAAKGLALQVEIGSLSGPLLGDALHIQNALHNYADNAVRFTDSGSITLRAMQVEADATSVLLRFEVEDSGSGIEAEALPRLFNMFEQADYSLTRKYGGAGLGLALTRKIARLMGGDAGCESWQGAGSLFWFTVRLRKAGTAA